MKKLIGYSAFSGSDIGYIILKDLGLNIEKYYSSEIDNAAISVSKKHFPEIHHLGDITKVDATKLKHVNYMSAGSPCQGFSRNGKGLNFDDPRSGLFFEWNKQRLIIQPDYFFLENVCMKKEWEDVITETLEVNPIKTNAGDYSAQKRPRTFWTNIPQVEEVLENITVRDILEPNAIPFSDFTEDEKGLFEFLEDGTLKVKNATSKGFLIAEDGDTFNCSFPNSDTRRGRVAKQKFNTLDRQCNQAIFHNGSVRKPSIVELCRSQGYPDNFLDGLTSSKARSIIGNGWNKPQVSALHLGLQNIFSDSRV